MNIEECPNMKELQKIMRSTSIAVKWFELGVELLKNDDHLAVIKADHPNDVKACCYEMFKKWLETTPNASWSQLVTALNNIQMNSVAGAISKQYKTGKDCYIAS